MPSRDRSNGVVLDDVSKAIIEQLQQDGRRPYAAIGKAVGLSEAAVRQRVQRLLESGVMQIVAVTDPLKLGLPVMALVGVAVDGDIRVVADQIATIPEVIYVVVTAGAYDMFIEVVCPDTDTLFGVVNDHIKSVDGVRLAESFVYFDIHTHRFTWDVPE